jgi:hypothetical protein
MGFLILPFVMVIAFIGLAMQAHQQADAVPGAGQPGQMEAAAVASGQRAEAYGSACAASAISRPGVVSSGLQVTLPPGVVAPVSSGCIAQADGSGGRLVYGWIAGGPGVSGWILKDTQMNAVWHQVQSAGVALNIVTAQTVAVPVAIPVGALVDLIQTNP